MGLVLMLSYRHYWQKAAQYGDKFVQKPVRIDWFLAILQFLHFGDSGEAYNNRLGKVTYLINHLKIIQ